MARWRVYRRNILAIAEQAPRWLGYRSPYALDSLLSFLQARAVEGIEQIDVGRACIIRSLRWLHDGQTHSGWLSAQFDPAMSRVGLCISPGLSPVAEDLMPALRRWLDLDMDPHQVGAVLGNIADAEPGLRLPGSLDRFELAVRAVLGQQVTVAAARTLASRFVRRFGTPLSAAESAPAALQFHFPHAADIAGLDVADIAALGIIRQRANSLIALARQWSDLAFAHQQGGIDDALQQLQSVPGIGPWTAHYMLMRGWSWADAFPPGDVVLKKQLSSAQAPLSPKQIQAVASTYAPYRSYAVLQLWRRAALAG